MDPNLGSADSGLNAVNLDCSFIRYFLFRVSRVSHLLIRPLLRSFNESRSLVVASLLASGKLLNISVPTRSSSDCSILALAILLLVGRSRHRVLTDLINAIFVKDVRGVGA